MGQISSCMIFTTSRNCQFSWFFTIIRIFKAVSSNCQYFVMRMSGNNSSFLLLFWPSLLKMARLYLSLWSLWETQQINAVICFTNNEQNWNLPTQPNFYMHKPWYLCTDLCDMPQTIWLTHKSIFETLSSLAWDKFCFPSYWVLTYVLIFTASVQTLLFSVVMHPQRFSCHCYKIHTEFTHSPVILNDTACCFKLQLDVSPCH